MKKLVTTLLTLSLLTASFPANSMATTGSWIKKNMYALIGTGIVAGIAAYFAYQYQTVTMNAGDERDIVVSLRDRLFTYEQSYRGTLTVKATEDSHTYMQHFISGPRHKVHKALKLLSSHPTYDLEPRCCSKDNPRKFFQNFILDNKLPLHTTFFISKKSTHLKELSLRNDSSYGNIQVDTQDLPDIIIQASTRQTNGITVKDKNGEKNYTTYRSDNPDYDSVPAYQPSCPPLIELPDHD